MYIENMEQFLPKDWHPMDIINKKYELVEVPKYSQVFSDLANQVDGGFNLGIESIYRIQNPYLYTKYYLRGLEYQARGEVNILSLFHDTCRSNLESILTYNLDWRFGERFKFGPGVYFSATAERANAYSNRNGIHRAMFMVDVLVGRIQKAYQGLFLPDPGFDTVQAMSSGTFIKYFDNEFYPQYVCLYLGR